MIARSISPNDALLVVDVQKDFCRGGALPIPDGDAVVPALNEWIEAFRAGGGRIVFSRDWHPPEHFSFQEQGGPWPRHCVRDSEGAKFHGQLNVPEEARIVSKGTARDWDNYSAFEQSGLSAQLASQGVKRLWVGGLAQDVCVRATVLDACRAGFEVHLIAAATRPVDHDRGRKAIEEMLAAGAMID